MNMRRSTAAALALVLALSTVPVRPARAESGASNYLVYGLLVGALTALGVLAYQTDYGEDKPLETPDRSGRKERKTTSIEIVPPPASDEEGRPAELGAGLALAARF